ncbi:phenylalanyl-tRNA synthetase beta subunit [Moritella sp. PE36]|uniref:phenylalanine--tRNA ligase subunit beta n=1 Tax=Moritella sp. PE36 TaxID=58051 RepID=UPI0001568DE7|nr:phenylalanine--tRNA ligase subunit beta [Moritella sp. PE36]EDM65347.1 phenylalanyl-tRNA synthetase beta subunit [Moritella sp. PE36]
MKFSNEWLQTWVKPGLTNEELAHQITMAGLEVDGIDAVAGDFTGIVVGHVVECGPHPDADKLQVTKIDIGAEELIDIVCGATNCRAGLKVAVATVGAVLPGDFKIKKAKLRGQPSHGMLCSESEMGMAESADGIMELPSDAVPGTCIRECLGLDDVTIEVDLTPNRADCLSIAGIAREVGVLNNIAVTAPEWTNVTETSTETVSVSVTATEQCPRYLGRVITNLDMLAKTPLWMVERLRRCGTRSIDPIVDVTNYVLLELGQPMHAFDLATLTGAINVRLATQDEKLTLLDGNEVKLNDNTLVIADDSGAIAMAGIFGGEKTGVTATTNSILLESAFFSPLAITGRARAYGLHTDSSHRFERGVDSELQYKAMERATQLIVEICGGEVAPVVDVTTESALPTHAPINLRRHQLDKVIGFHVEDAKVTDILNSLGLSPTFENDTWTVTSPSFRFDIEVEVDLIEEVARVFGYDNIPNVAPVAPLKMTDHNEATLPVRRIRDLMVNRGFQEAITYSFVDPKRQLLLHPEADHLVLPHPISIEMSVMRVSMFTGLIEAVVSNQKRQQQRIRLFETGLTFIKDESVENGVLQVPMLGAIIAGTANAESWNQESKSVDYFDLKGDLDALLDQTCNSDEFVLKRASHPGLHPGQSAEIFHGGRSVGHIGAVHPSLEKKLGLNASTIILEIELATLTSRKLPQALEVSKFPANRRDIAMIVKDDVNAGDVLNFIKKVGGNQLVGINLFDVYQGTGVVEGHKSLAISLTLQDISRTLEEKEISEAVNNIVEGISSEFNASLRD